MKGNKNVLSEGVVRDRWPKKYSMKENKWNLEKTVTAV